MILLLCAVMINTTGTAQTAIQMRPLPAGSVTPEGWIRQQMQQDLKGFIGQLDTLVASLFADDIYGRDRLGKKSKIKELGNNKEGDAEGSEQYQWWNSETQSNWWDGYIRQVWMSDDTSGKQKVHNYVQHILATQDEDGYLGIYDSSLRYHFSGENGELWSKATLYRGLLAYYELTGNKTVQQAVIRAVANVMQHYPVLQSSPFESGTGYNGGVSHGLMFTDVLFKLFLQTGRRQYLDYALFLYQDYSKTRQSEKDAQEANVRNNNYRPQSHAVHTYEHMRSIVTASLSDTGAYMRGLTDSYVNKITTLVTVTGGAIGDEWIGGRTASETNTGYEYCSLQELMHGYMMLLQVRGEAAYGDAAENIFYNAAQGSRHPEKSCIAYLKTDNSFTMDGTRNGEAEKDRKQTRYKYSPAHQDVAVCCVPNAGRIAPYFVEQSWLQAEDGTLVFALLGPCKLTAVVDGTPVTIKVKTAYPYANDFVLTAASVKPVNVKLMIRKPNWVQKVQCSKSYSDKDGWISTSLQITGKQTIRFSYTSATTVGNTAAGEKYFRHGAIVYALPLPATEQAGKMYGLGMQDLMYVPKQQSIYSYIPGQKLVYNNNTITTTLFNTTTGKPALVKLVPLSKTILRQVSFKERR